MPLLELLYTSFVTSPMSDQELIQLLEQARKQKCRLGITALLIYNHRELAPQVAGRQSQY